jgi:hypothetical protein
MDRIKLIMQERKTMLVVALAAVVIAIIAAIGSGAFYTTTSTNPGNAFTAGTMTMSNSATNTAFITAGDLWPGTDVNGSVTIGNTNPVGSLLGLKITSIDETAGPNGTDADVLSPDLNLTVTDDTSGTVLYTGTLADAAAADYLTTGTVLPAGVQHTFGFKVGMADNGEPGDVADPASGDNVFQGAKSTVGFTWVLETAH